MRRDSVRLAATQAHLKVRNRASSSSLVIQTSGLFFFYRTAHPTKNKGWLLETCTYHWGNKKVRLTNARFDGEHRMTLSRETVPQTLRVCARLRRGMVRLARIKSMPALNKTTPATKIISRRERERERESIAGRPTWKQGSHKKRRN